MQTRGGHYERAFEHYLRARRAPYVSVDEARRALLPRDNAGSRDDSLKSFDFVVYGEGRNLLLDVKGRKVARRAGASGVGRLESWVTRADVESLLRWEAMFGAGFEGVFVFLYWCDAQPPDGLYQEVFARADRWYAVRAVSVRDYARAMKPRSARWGTVDVPTRVFERISRPFCPPPSESAANGPRAAPGPSIGPPPALQPPSRVPIVAQP